MPGNFVERLMENTVKKKKEENMAEKELEQASNLSSSKAKMGFVYITSSNWLNCYPLPLQAICAVTSQLKLLA